MDTRWRAPVNEDPTDDHRREGRGENFPIISPALPWSEGLTRDSTMPRLRLTQGLLGPVSEAAHFESPLLAPDRFVQDKPGKSINIITDTTVSWYVHYLQGNFGLLSLLSFVVPAKRHTVVRR